MSSCSVNPLYVSDPDVISGCSVKKGRTVGIVVTIVAGILYALYERGSLLMKHKINPDAKLKRNDFIRMALVYAGVVGLGMYVLPRVIISRAVRNWESHRESLALLQQQGLSPTDAMRQVQANDESKRHATSLLTSAAALGMLIR